MGSRHPPRSRKANASVTAGLRCAPETGSNTITSTVSAAPVARALASKASPTMPPARRAPITPDPTTTARSRALPSASAAMRRTGSGATLSADLLHPPLQGDPVQPLVGQGGKRVDAVEECPVGFGESGSDHRLAAFRCGGIGHAPMGADRSSGPDRAGFAGRVVTHRDDEIERRRARPGEFAPRFRPEPVGRITETLEQRQGMRVDLAGWRRAGGVGDELPLSQPVHDRFREDRPRRISGAEEEDAPGTLAHAAGPQQGAFTSAGRLPIAGAPPP